LLNFVYILYVKRNVLYIGSPNVQARWGPNHLAPALNTRQVKRT